MMDIYIFGLLLAAVVGFLVGFLCKYSFAYNDAWKDAKVCIDAADERANKLQFHLNAIQRILNQQ
jgi:hypothetical protein